MTTPKCKYPCWRKPHSGKEWCYIHEPREAQYLEPLTVKADRDAKHLHEKAGLALNEYGLGEGAFKDPKMAVMLARLLFLE